MKIFAPVTMSMAVMIIVLALAVSGPVAARGCRPGHKAPRQLDPPVARIVEGNTVFACDLYSRLRMNSGNMSLSPYEIGSSMIMAYAGASGVTAEEMGRTLHLPPFEALLSALPSLTGLLSRNAAHELAKANAMWVVVSRQVGSSYRQLCKKTFLASLRELDPGLSPEGKAALINEWIRQNTEGRFNQLLLRGDVNREAALVLTSAAEHHGEWSQPFDPAQPGAFRLASGKTIQVPMMATSGSFAYYESTDLQLVELPYYGQDASMWILLPKCYELTPWHPYHEPIRPGLPREWLDALEKQLTSRNLQIWNKALEEYSLVLSMPRFCSTQRLDLREILPGMGMSRAFSPGAEFNGIAADAPLSISTAIHQATVEVSEKGTGTLGATAGPRMRACEISAVVEVDHPFLYLIWDNRTGTLLFMGRVVDPTAPSS